MLQNSTVKRNVYTNNNACDSPFAVFDWDSWRSIYPYFGVSSLTMQPSNDYRKPVKQSWEVLHNTWRALNEFPWHLTFATYFELHDDVIKWKHFRVTGHLCGEFTGPGEFPTQRPVTRRFDVFFDLRLNKWWSKQSWGWWFETLSHQLWRQCNEKLDDVSIFEEKVHCKLINIDTPSTNLQPRENYE